MSNDNHTEYNRDDQRQWGRTILRLRESGTFAQLLSAEIAHSKLTVREIAEHCQTSSASINKWKGGDVYPAVHFLWRLAKILHPEHNTIGAYMIYTHKINAER